MKSSDKPRDLFGSSDLTDAQLAEIRTKLVWATNHVVRYRNQLATISAPFKEAVKHNQKMAEAIAESIKHKSTLPLEQEFGVHWEQKVSDLQALYTKHDDDIAAAKDFGGRDAP